MVNGTLGGRGCIGVVKAIWRRRGSMGSSTATIAPTCFDHAPPLAGGGRRVVGGPQDALEVRQLSDKLLLGEDVVSARDDVCAGGFQLGGNLGGQPEPAGGVLAVDDRQIRAELLLQGRQDGLDGVPARMADDVGHE